MKRANLAKLKTQKSKKENNQKWNASCLNFWTGFNERREKRVDTKWQGNEDGHIAVTEKNSNCGIFCGKKKGKCTGWFIKTVIGYLSAMMTPTQPWVKDELLCEDYKRLQIYFADIHRSKWGKVSPWQPNKFANNYFVLKKMEITSIATVITQLGELPITSSYETQQPNPVTSRGNGRITSTPRNQGSPLKLIFKKDLCGSKHDQWETNLEMWTWA